MRTIEDTNIDIKGILEGEETDTKTERLSEEVMTENFPFGETTEFKWLKMQ